MSRRRGRNIPASIHARLRKLRKSGEELNPLLQRYVAERFLYRLGASDLADRFILKGASLFLVWNVDVYRGTRDIDLLGTGLTTQDELRRDLDTICAISCPEDGVVFDPSQTSIRHLPVDDGLATRFGVVGILGRIRLPLQVDIGVGDPIHPPPKRLPYPTLLGHPQPVVWVYPRETLIAEKFAAMVVLGQNNSRIKDVWDIAALATNFAFNGRLLQGSIRATLLRRKALRKANVAALNPAYYDEPDRQVMWTTFRSQVGFQGYNPTSLPEAGAVVCDFLMPVWISIVDEQPFPMEWPPSGPWQLQANAPLGQRNRR